jgi:hypothetical protein
MAHGYAREGKWRGNWRMEWVANTLYTTSEHDVSSITTADAHTSAASSRLNWSLRRFKWTRPFRRKTKSGFCACAITFQTQSNSVSCYWTFALYLYFTFVLFLRTASYEILTGNSGNVHWIEALVATAMRRIAAHKHSEGNFALHLHYTTFSK